MTREIVQARLANLSAILALLSDAPMDEVAKRLPEIIDGLKSLQISVNAVRELKQGEMRIV